MQIRNGRTCLHCRKSGPKETLFRFAVSNGVIDLSPSGGKGLYLHRECIKAALLKGTIEKSLKGKLSEKCLKALEEMK